jgi:DNA-binding MarR family transcriptional regulator
VNEVRAASPLAELLASLHGVEARLEGALEPLGLSLGKFGLLSNLMAADEPLPLRALAERCACVRSNITQLVDRLEADGLVTREADPEDRRSVRASLTSKGRSRHLAASTALADAERDVLAPLSKEQRDVLVTLLRTLRSGP